MIEKGVNYGGVSNTTMVTFGSGDIRIDAGYSLERETTCVLLLEAEPKDISLWREVDERGVNEFDNIVSLEFTRPKSIDMLIEALQEAKENFDKYLKTEENEELG